MIVATNKQCLFLFLIVIEHCLCVCLVRDAYHHCQTAQPPSLLLLPPSLSLEFLKYHFVLGVECIKMTQLAAK